CVTPTRLGVGYCRMSRRGTALSGGSSDHERGAGSVPGDSARVLTDAPVAASSRSLSTARAVLRVFALLLENPEGVRADEVATALVKSVSTASYLLTRTREGGFAVHECKGVYRRARGLEELTATVGEQTH